MPERLIVHECDDGIFNERWWEYTDLPQGTCEWPLTRCADKAKWECTECGGKVCDRHRKNHMDSKWHHIKKEEANDVDTEE